MVVTAAPWLLDVEHPARTATTTSSVAPTNLRRSCNWLGRERLNMVHAFLSDENQYGHTQLACRQPRVAKNLTQALVKDGGSYWATVLLGIAAAVAVGAVVYSSVEWFNSRDRTKSGENI